MNPQRRLIGAAAVLGCLVLAGVWTVVVPDKAETAPALQAFVVRWGHPVCWVLLAGTAASWAFGGPRRLTEGLAYAALASYAAFLLATVL